MADLHEDDDDNDSSSSQDFLHNRFHPLSSLHQVDFGLDILRQNPDNPNSNNDADSLDDLNLHGARFESDASYQSSDSDETGESDIISVVDEDYDPESSFHLGWESFHLHDENPNPYTNSDSNANANEDFEWEEVDDRIDERESLNMFFGVEPDDDASVSPVLLTAFEEQPNEEHLQWQVLSNVHDFEPDPDSEVDQYDDYNYTEYEMFFGQFGDSDLNVPSSIRPPASKTAVDNLSTVVMTQEDVVNNNAVCAVCKDEVAVGEMVTWLPCSHGYHGECILPWLAVRNTCPVCRHELPTDDVEYERRKAERGG